MGLDMYLEKMPRYKNTTVEEVMVIENYFSYLNSAKDCSFEEWSGCSKSKLPSEDVINFYKPYYRAYYSSWDTGKNYPWRSLTEEVGYWRKANQIHNWFVENVQNGVDDCGYYECTEEDLDKLLEICMTVKNGITMVPGKIHAGTTYHNNGTVTENYEDGMVIEDTSIAEELLPTCAGFFFGGTAYDECYMEDIDYTIKLLQNVLATTDFEKEMICYHSSW